MATERPVHAWRRLGRPVAMSHVSLLVLERDERAVVESLGELGAVHLSQEPLPPGLGLRSTQRQRDGLSTWTAQLTRVLELRAQLQQATGETAAARPPHPRERCLEGWEHSAAELLARRAELSASLARSRATLDALGPFLGLGLPPLGPGTGGLLAVFVGSVPRENLAGLRAEAPADAALAALAATAGPQPLVALALRASTPALEQALGRAGFQAAEAPTHPGSTVDSIAAECRAHVDTGGQALAQLDARLAALQAECGASLVAMERQARRELQLLAVEESLARTGSACLVTGWVPASRAGELAQRIAAACGARHALEVSAAEDWPEDQVPTLLPHRWLLRPFEALLTAYGLPRYGELVPTAVVAVSFVLMFGMMFGDAGQGAVLLAVGVAATRWSRSETTRGAGIVMALDGVASMVFGAVYGSCFGIPALRRYALWRDPLDVAPASFMYAGIAVGTVVVTAGLLLNAANLALRRDFVGAVLDRFGVAGLAFYWGVLGLFINHADINARGVLLPAAVVGVPVAAWLLREPVTRLLRPPLPGGPGLGGVLAESVVGAIEAANAFLANTVSFVRLAAYALSHAAAVLAAFSLAGELRGVPVIGGGLSVLAIVVGNLVAMALEGVIASVQALRLEYYEFFSKFFTGSGHPYTPFQLPPRAAEAAP